MGAATAHAAHAAWVSRNVGGKMMPLEHFLPVYLIAGTALIIANVVWGFRDGRRRGRSGILVAMLVLWTFPLGVLLWLLFRPDIVEEPEPSEDRDIVEELEPTEDPDHELKRRANAGTL